MGASYTSPSGGDEALQKKINNQSLVEMFYSVLVMTNLFIFFC